MTDDAGESSRKTPAPGRSFGPYKIIEPLGAGGMGPGNADGVSAMTVGTAPLLGLVARQRTGRAQSMLTSMICSTSWANSAQMIRYEGKPDGPYADPLLYGMNALYRLYPTAEGWVFVACVQDDEWSAFADVLDSGAEPADVGLANDPRFASANGSSPQAYQFTGLCACCWRYGLVSNNSRLE